MQSPQPETTGVNALTTMGDDGDDMPMSGGIPDAVGQASVVRIPVPALRSRALRIESDGSLHRQQNELHRQVATCTDGDADFRHPRLKSSSPRLVTADSL